MIQPRKKVKTKAKKPPKPVVETAGGLAPIKNLGTPAHEPTKATRNLVLLGCSTGRTQEQIAKLLGVSEMTLRKYYSDELADGGHRITLAIAGNLANIAQDRNHPKAVTAAIFWLKTKGGFREETPTGDPDNPVEKVTFTINIGGSGSSQPGDRAKLVNG